MAQFVADLTTALDAFVPNWGAWITGAFAVGAFLRVAPRLVKRFM